VLQKGQSGIAFFRFVSEELADRVRDLTMEEQMVFNSINDAGAEGALASQFKTVVGQSQAKVNAILKKLEKEGLVKQLTSLSKNGRKVWMLSEVEPSLTVTGGLSGA
jgi:DNA-directed RNA polymerase III subunit RPC6